MYDWYNGQWFDITDGLIVTADVVYILDFYLMQHQIDAWYNWTWFEYTKWCIWYNGYMLDVTDIVFGTTDVCWDNGWMIDVTGFVFYITDLCRYERWIIDVTIFCQLRVLFIQRMNGGYRFPNGVGNGRPALPPCGGCVCELTRMFLEGSTEVRKYGRSMQESSQVRKQGWK